MRAWVMCRPLLLAEYNGADWHGRPRPGRVRRNDGRWRTGGSRAVFRAGAARPDTRDRITAADLRLNVVPAPVSLNLLEGHLGILFNALLRHILATIELGEPAARDHVLPRSFADQAWQLLNEQDGVGWVTAGKLMARKRSH